MARGAARQDVVDVVAAVGAFVGLDIDLPVDLPRRSVLSAEQELVDEHGGRRVADVVDHRQCRTLVSIGAAGGQGRQDPLGRNVHQDRQAAAAEQETADRTGRHSAAALLADAGADGRSGRKVERRRCGKAPVVRAGDVYETVAVGSGVDVSAVGFDGVRLLHARDLIVGLGIFGGAVCVRWFFHRRGGEALLVTQGVC